MTPAVGLGAGRRATRRRLGDSDQRSSVFTVWTATGGVAARSGTDWVLGQAAGVAGEALIVSTSIGVNRPSDPAGVAGGRCVRSRVHRAAADVRGGPHLFGGGLRPANTVRQHPLRYGQSHSQAEGYPPTWHAGIFQDALLFVLQIGVTAARRSAFMRSSSSLGTRARLASTSGWFGSRSR